MGLEIRTDEVVLNLSPGQCCAFGRGLDLVELVLTDDPRVHRHAGTIEVDERGWTVHNDGRWLHIRVSCVDRGGVDVLGPGESLRVPWLHARVDILVGTDMIGFDAFQRVQHVQRVMSLSVDAGEERTVTPIGIDRRSGAFRALVALCEPRLGTGSHPVLPTNPQIAARLNRSGYEDRRITAKTVERRLDYCRRRLNLVQRSDGESLIGADTRDVRRQLVEAAVMVGVVTVDDLEVLGDNPYADGASGTRTRP